MGRQYEMNMHWWNQSVLENDHRKLVYKRLKHTLGYGIIVVNPNAVKYVKRMKELVNLLTP